MEENIEVLKKELERKEKIFEEKYVLNMKENDYLSEEAEQMRKEIQQLRSKIRKMKDNASCNEEDIKILENYLNKFAEYMVCTKFSTKSLNELENALKNLIKGYRELKKANRELEKAIKQIGANLEILDISGSQEIIHELMEDK